MRKTNRILLDGVDHTDGAQGIHDIELSYTLDQESRTVTYSTSSEIVFKFAAYELLRDTFFVGDGCDNKIVATLVLGCCNNEGLEFEINYRTISDYCPTKCEITSRLQERTPDQQAYDCLLSSIYWQDATSGVTWLQHLNSYPVPKFEYCAEPKGISPIIIAALSTILGVVAAGIGASGGFTAALGAGIVAALIPILLSLFKFGDCGRKHPGTPLRAIIDYAMLRCGLTFESNTIISMPPYGDTHLIQCQYVEGSENPPDWIADNAANLNFIQLLDQLQPVFNSDYRIRNGVFKFERKDEFLRLLPAIGNIDDLYRNGCSEKAPCYHYSTDRPCAIGRFEYTPDAIDTGGNEVANLVYSDIVEWNEPVREIARGQCQTINNFSPVNYVGMGPDSINADLDSGLIGKWYIKQGVSSQLKLIILNPASPIDNSKPVTFPAGSFDVGSLVNYPLWYDEKLLQNELYKNFHFIDDPRLHPCPAQADDFEFAPENFCDLVTMIRENGTDLKVETALGDMKADEIIINFEKNTITLKSLKTFFVGT